MLCGTRKVQQQYIAFQIRMDKTVAFAGTNVKEFLFGFQRVLYNKINISKF